MHNAILARLKADASQSLARFASGQDESISIVGAYGDDTDYPVWIGKTSSDKRGIERLRKERDALAYLQPWSRTFHLPGLLHFEESDTEICLIQTGVSGFPSHFESANAKELPRPAIQALEWLEKFQACVLPPENLSLAAMVDRLLQDFQSSLFRNRAVDGLLDILKREQPGDRIRPTATHGDFWRGNILFGPAGIGVVDWDELRTSFALEDVLTFVLSCVPSRIATAVERFEYAFFSSSAATRYLSNKIRDTAMSEEEARYWFYFFVGKRLVWKEFNDDWQVLLDWFSKRNYPTPSCFR